MSDLNDRYTELEGLVNDFAPELLDAIKSGNRLVFFREDITAPFLSDRELLLLGAIIKVAGRLGLTIIIGPYQGVAMLHPKVSGEEPDSTALH